jgi:hypothetical protein
VHSTILYTGSDLEVLCVLFVRLHSSVVENKAILKISHYVECVSCFQLFEITTKLLTHRNKFSSLIVN